MSLKKVVIIARHGPREPILVIPKLTSHYNQYTNSSESKLLHIANLTSNGKKVCAEFGVKLGKQYKDKLGLDFKKDVFIASSNVNRTIESAQIVMNNFSPNEKLFIKVHIDESLAGDIRFQGDNRQKFRNGVKNAKIDYDTTEIDQNIKKHFDITVTHSNKYFDIASTLKCHEYDNLDMSHLSQTFFDTIYKCAHMYYHKLYSDQEITNLFIDPLLETINKIITTKDIKFAYLSTHDCMIYPLAYKLNNHQIVHMPEFCSYVTYEIYDDCTKIYYDDKLLKIIN